MSNTASLPPHKYHEWEGRSGHHTTLPYHTGTQVVHTRMGSPKVPHTSGVSAIVPFPYTIVDTKTLGSAATMRTRRAGTQQEP
jgi:hypothetical protein